MLQTVENTAPKKKGGLHYAFVICLGGFLTQFIVLSAQRLPAISLESIRQTLGVSYAEVGLITSIYMVFYAGLSFAWGMAADKFGTKRMIVLACGLAAVGAISFGLLAPTGLIPAIVTWSIAGCGTAGLLMAILPKIVSRWFAPEKRGMGMSLISPGANFSAIILGVVAPIIIASTGWCSSRSRSARGPKRRAWLRTAPPRGRRLLPLPRSSSPSKLLRPHRRKALSCAF